MHKYVTTYKYLIDNERRKNDIYAYYELGFDNIIAISGEHNIGISNLLDEITKDFTPYELIDVNDDKIFVTDFSTNGTTINGVKIEKNKMTEINPGDEVAFADMAFLVENAD